MVSPPATLPAGRVPVLRPTTMARTTWRQRWDTFAPWVRVAPMAVVMTSGGVVGVPIVSYVPFLFPIAAGFVAAQVIVRLTLRGFTSKPLIGWALFLFGVGFGPALLWSSFNDSAKIAELYSLALLAFCAPMFLLDEPKDVLRLVVVAGAIGFIGSIGFLHTGALATMYNWERLSFGEVGSIVTGRIAGTAVIAAYLLAIHTRHWWLFVLAVPSAVVLLNTGALGPNVAVAAAIVASSIRSLCHRGGWKRTTTLALLIAPIVVGALSTLPESRLRRLLQVGRNEFVRAEIWNHVLAQSPWGTGWGDFGELGLGPRFEYAHNIFFEALSEGGIIALIAFTAVLGTALYRSRLSGPAFTVLIYWTLNALVSMSITGNRAMLLTMGCCLTLPYLSRGRGSHRAVRLTATEHNTQALGYDHDTYGLDRSFAGS